MADLLQVTVPDLVHEARQLQCEQDTIAAAVTEGDEGSDSDKTECEEVLPYKFKLGTGSDKKNQELTDGLLKLASDH
jgi:hypothetical protein